MIDKVIIFYGSKKDFDSRLQADRVESSFTDYMSIIRDYNAKLRPATSRNEGDSDTKRQIPVLVVRADEFGSVLDHVIHNFMSIITCHHDIEILYIHNPPKPLSRQLRT